MKTRFIAASLMSAAALLAAPSTLLAQSQANYPIVVTNYLSQYVTGDGVGPIFNEPAGSCYAPAASKGVPGVGGYPTYPCGWPPTIQATYTAWTEYLGPAANQDPVCVFYISATPVNGVFVLQLSTYSFNTSKYVCYNDPAPALNQTPPYHPVAGSGPLKFYVGLVGQMRHRR